MLNTLITLTTTPAPAVDASWVEPVTGGIQELLGVLTTPPLPMFIGLTFVGVALGMILRIVKR